LDIVQQQDYQSRVHNVDELKQKLLHARRGIDQTVIDNASDQWLHLRACVRAKGGHFEHSAV